MNEQERNLSLAEVLLGEVERQRQERIQRMADVLVAEIERQDSEAALEALRTLREELG